VRSKNTVNPNYLILQIIKIYNFSLACPPSFWRDRRIIGCPLLHSIPSGNWKSSENILSNKKGVAVKIADMEI